MANDINIGGAFLDVGVDSSPAEKALASFFKHFDQVGSKAMDLAENISDTVVKAEMLGKKGGEAVNNFAKSYDSVKQKTTETMKTVDNLRSKIDVVAKGGSASYQMLAGKIDASNKTISDSSKSTLNGMKTDYAAANQAIYADTQKTNALIATSFKQSFGALKSSFNDLKAGFQSLGKSILGIFDKPLNAIQTTFKRVMSVTMKDVTGFFQSGFAQAKNAALSQLNAIKTAITSIPEKARSAVNQAKLSLVSGFSSAANAIANVVSRMGNGLANLPARAAQAARNLKQSFINQVQDIPNKMSNIWASVKNGLSNLPNTARNVASSVKSHLSNGFQAVVSKAKAILPGVKTGIKTNIDDPAKAATGSVKGMALAFAGIQVAAGIVRKAFSVVQSSVGGAINRIDTMNNSTRTFANMGFGAEEVSGTMEGLEQSINGLPTPLDSAVRGLQMLTASTGNLGKSQKVFAALNNGILGFGGNAEMVDNAIMQLSQALGNGKIDAQTWNSMVNSGMMPVLNALAKQMGITTAQMKEGLSDGTISVDTFQDALVDLNENGGGGLASLQQIAKDSTKGIGTSIANAKTAITKGTTAIITSVSKFLEELTGKNLATLISESGVKAKTTLENIAKMIEKLAKPMKALYKVVEPLVPLIKMLMAAFGAYMGLAVVLQLMSKLYGLIAFNPFVLLVVTLVTLVSLFKRAYDKSADFRRIIDQLTAPFALFSGLVQALGNALKNAFEQKDFTGGLRALGSYIPRIAETFVEALPRFFEVGKELLFSLLSGIGEAITGEKDATLSQVITKLVQGLLDGAWQLITVGFQFLMFIGQGILKNLPMILGVVGKILDTIFLVITNAADWIAQNGGTILVYLIEGIVMALGLVGAIAWQIISFLASKIGEYLPVILQKGYEIVSSLISGVAAKLPEWLGKALELILYFANALAENFPTIIAKGWEIAQSLIRGIGEKIPELLAAAVVLIAQLAGKLLEHLPEIIAVGAKLVVGLISGLWEFAKGLAEFIGGFFDSMWKGFSEIDWASIGKNILDGILGGLSKGWGKVKKAAGDLGGNIKDWFEKKMGIASPSKVMIASAVWVPEGVAVGIEKGLPTIKKAMNKVTDTMDKAVKDAKPIDLKANVIKTEHYGMPDASKLNAAAQQATQASDQGMQNNAPQLLNTAAQAAAGVVNSFNSMAPQMSAEGTDWINNFIQGFASQTGTFAAQTQAFGTNTIATLNAFDPAQNQSGLAWINNLSTGFGSVIPGFLAQANGLATQTQTILNSYIPSMYQSGLAWIQNIYNAWNSLVSMLLNLVTTTVNSAWSIVDGMQSSFYNAGRALMQNLINGISSMGSALDQTMRGVANQMLSGIEKGVNGVVGGVNYVLKEVESDKSLNTWTAPRYAKGTEAHPGGPAIINDQPGDTYKELVQLPTGESFIAKTRNALMWLPKGAKVLNARLTKQFMGFGKSIPKYADGIGDMEIDIEELINNKEVFKKLINDQIQYASIMEPWKNMTSSAVKVMTDQAYEFVKKKAEELFMGSGSRAEFIKNVLAQKGKQYVWGAEGPDTFDCSGLIKWALGQIGISFPHYTGDQWNATDHITEAEAKPGDLIYFGSNASRHVGMYTKKGEMFNASMPNAYGPGNGIGYSPYAAADLWGFARIRQLTDGIAAGGGRNYGGNWANAIRDAAKKMRVSINDSDVQTILSLIQHESGGNEKIVQSSSVWDINMANGNPARGLLQFIPSTFSAYSVKGYNNIMSGYDQLLALFNNANWRGDIHPWGGWGPTGHRRYENGGLIMNEQIAHVGEGNKPEMIIPLTKPERALQLIMQALSYLGRNGGNIISNAASGISTITSNTVSQFSDGINGVGKLNINMILGTDLAQVVTLLRENNDLLRVIAESDDVIVMDNTIVGRKVAPTVKKEIDRADRTARRGRGDR